MAPDGRSGAWMGGMSLREKLKHWLRERRVMRECGCICYCPNCRNILNDNAQYFDRGLNQDVYICNVCNCESLWSFNLAPVPILISSDHDKAIAEMSEYRRAK